MPRRFAYIGRFSFPFGGNLRPTSWWAGTTTIVSRSLSRRMVWLFTVPDPKRNHSLCLFSSSHLEGPRSGHPRSPIVNCNPHLARPAGRALNARAGRLDYAQDDSPWYARQVWALEVAKLTSMDYSERLVTEEPLRPRRFKWNLPGMHHIDPRHLDGKRWWPVSMGIEMGGCSALPESHSIGERWLRTGPFHSSNHQLESRAKPNWYKLLLMSPEELHQVPVRPAMIMRVDDKPLNGSMFCEARNTMIRQNSHFGTYELNDRPVSSRSSYDSNIGRSAKCGN
jgi:hypothetical protein